MAHTINVKAPAMTVNAKLACAALVDTAPSISAPLELPDEIALPAEPAVEGDPELEGVVSPRGAELDGATEEGVMAGAGADAGEVLFELVVPVLPGRYDGGATALDGSARAPMPQGIASPSGCV